MGEQINKVAARLLSSAAASFSCDTQSSSVRTLSGPVPVDLARTLEAMASLHHCDTACLTGELLTAAIQDIVSALPQASRERIRQTKADQANAEAEAHDEALSWDPGRT